MSMLFYISGIKIHKMKGKSFYGLTVMVFSVFKLGIGQVFAFSPFLDELNCDYDSNSRTYCRQNKTQFC